MSIPSRVYEQRSADSDQRRRYFLNAYAVSVTGGSEPGMGFAWFRQLALQYHVVLFTEAEFSEALIAWLQTEKSVSCTVHFFDLGDEARSRCWNQGDWRFYWAYWAYQRAVLKAARAEMARGRPVVLHQLNMIGFREPGYFWWLGATTRTPFMWGPVGGYNFPSPGFYKAYGAVAQARQAVKNVLNLASMLLPSVIGAYARASVLLLAIPPRGALMPALLRRGHLFPETFLRQDASHLAHAAAAHDETTSNQAPQLRMAMLGKLVPRKLVDIAIEAVARLEADKRQAIRIDIIGDGPSRPTLEALVKAHDLGAAFHFHGNVAHDRAMALVSAADALMHCSVDEGTSHAVVEALSLGKPVLAFDCGGHAVIARSAGVVLEPAPRTRAQGIDLMAQALRRALQAPRSSWTAPSTAALAAWTAGERIQALQRIAQISPSSVSQ